MAQPNGEVTANPQSTMRDAPYALEGFAAPRPGLRERRLQGKAQRQQVPLSRRAEYRMRTDDEGPLSILERQNANRVASLIPLRMARMRESRTLPDSAFQRGATRSLPSAQRQKPRLGRSGEQLSRPELPRRVLAESVGGRDGFRSSPG
jgi:hypothetical protein